MATGRIIASRASGGAAICAIIALIGFAPALHAQINLQPGAGAQQEKFPTPRDPSYVAPLLPQSTIDETQQGELGGSALIFSAGGGGDLVSLFAERRAAQLEAARRADRYGERNAQYLDETGQDRVLLEQNLLRQFGSSRGLPRDFGDGHYSETPARRFSIVFLISLPVTAGVIGGIYQTFGPGVTINGPPDYPALLGIIGIGSVFSALIGYYDYTRMAELRAHTVGHRAREAYHLRNHPFGRRGAKGDEAPRNTEQTPDTTGLRAYPATVDRFDYTDAVAGEDARRVLERLSGARSRAGFARSGAESGGAGDGSRQLLGISWRFAY